jgi:hypothetical protein
VTVADGNYVIAVDLGQQVDPTAACVVERQIEIVERGFDQPEYRDHHVVRALRRWPLHTSYDDVVADVADLVRARGLQDAVIALDLTGPGRLAGRVFIEAYLEGKLGSRYPWAFVVTGAQTPSHGGHVTKRDLVTNALIAFNRGRVHVPPDIPYAAVLRDELAGYSRRVSASGVSIFENGSRDPPHDDLVFALMLGLYAKSGLPESCRVFRNGA